MSSASELQAFFGIFPVSAFSQIKKFVFVLHEEIFHGQDLDGRQAES